MKEEPKKRGPKPGWKKAKELSQMELQKPLIKLPSKQSDTEVRIVINEAGSSGLKTFQGFVSEAYHTQLYWPGVQPLYSKLRTSMPELVMIRRAFSSWAHAITPMVDMPKDPSDGDKKYRDFLLSEFDNMEGGFGSFVDTLVNHVPFFGWGWWEVVPGLRNQDWKPPDADDNWRSEEDDDLIGIRRLAWRDTSTFDGWIFNSKKRMKGMYQRDWPNNRIQLDLDKSLHITFGDSVNPEGSSPLEAVWRLERIRYGYEVIMGIGFEHAAGYLNVTKTEGGDLTAEDITNIGKAAQHVMSAQEGNYAAWPPGIDGQVKDIPFAASGSLLNAIKHYNLLALAVFMMQFIGLNTFTDKGALASAKDSSQVAVFTFNSMMDGFATQYDRQIGRRLWDWNVRTMNAFPGATKRPIIRFSHVEKDVSLLELGQFLSTINGIVQLGDADQIAIRQKTDFLPEELPEPSEIQNETEDKFPDVGTSTTKPDTKPVENPEEEDVNAEQ
jgi:hypothetical protein